jgi:hypothetical protein
MMRTNIDSQVVTIVHIAPTPTSSSLPLLITITSFFQKCGMSCPLSRRASIIFLSKLNKQHSPSSADLHLFFHRRSQGERDGQYSDSTTQFCGFNTRISAAVFF